MSKQIDCFNIHMKFFTFIGIWPGNFDRRYYEYYSKILITVFIIIFNLLLTVSFYFVEKNVDSIIEDMIFYFLEIACTSKVFTFLLMRDDIVKMLSILESDMFQPMSKSGLNIVRNAKELNMKYWKIIAGISVTAHIAHIFMPIINHIFLAANLEMPVCSYSFLSNSFKETYKYPLFLYQSIGIHLVMWYNININTFVFGVMILAIAQLDILDENLRIITEDDASDEFHLNSRGKEVQCNLKLNDSIVHFNEVSKFCALIQHIFGTTYFIQFSVSAYIICVCLFRFTLPAPMPFYIFLITYMTCMVIDVLLPCWYGTQIIEKSTNISQAIYACDWISRSRRFRRNMLFFMMRTMQPLTITGWKMFPLSLKTFTAIIKSSYSAFALLRHMQARQ